MVKANSQPSVWENIF